MVPKKSGLLFCVWIANNPEAVTSFLVAVGCRKVSFNGGAQAWANAAGVRVIDFDAASVR